MRKRKLKSVKDELVKKSREAMLAAVQIYNNPHITFKSETYISLAIVAWTYLLHAYYRSQKIDYRYHKAIGSKKSYDKTKHGAYKHWELERCLNDDLSPIDKDTALNLRFLIGIRHEIEHQMTNKIDEHLSAKLQACAINYNYYLRKLFGDKYSMDRELALTIQFAPISPEQEEILLDNDKLTGNVKNFIATFEKDLSSEQMVNNHYAYRVVYVPVNVNRKGQADRVIEFIKPDSPLAEGINKEYAFIKETERRKYLPGDIIKLMQAEGFASFKMGAHTRLWQTMDAKNTTSNYGVNVAKTWYWYDSWLNVVREYCAKNKSQYE